MQGEMRQALRFAGATGRARRSGGQDPDTTIKNMLTSAQMASDRLAMSGDPQVAKALPRLERALDRAL